jgi:3-oxoadipate enol-lactonase
MMPELTLHGASIHYTENKPTSKPDALILLHGFPLHSGMWQAQLESLPATWRIIAPDFRGFGQSSATGPFTIEQLADDTYAMVQQLGLGKIVLAGLSMGGYAAFAFARKYPQSLRGLILLDTTAKADTPEGKENRDRLIAIANEKGAKPIAQAMLGKLIPEETAKHRPHLAQELREMMESTRPQTIANALAAMRDRPDQTAMLPSINVPTLIGVGDQDTIAPPDVAQAMQAAIPNAHLQIFTGSGHMSAMEQPSQVNAAIASFLSKI